MGGKVILEFYLIEATYSIGKDGKSDVKLIGRTKEGKKVIVLDSTFKPYFYAIFEKEQIDDAKLEIEKIKVTSEDRVIKPQKIDIVEKRYMGKFESAIKIEVDRPTDIAEIKYEITRIPGFKKITEDDIKFYKRYLVDKGIVPLTPVRVTGINIGELKGYADYVIDAETISQVSDDSIDDLKIMSFDIETYNPNSASRPEVDPILMISMSFSNGKEKVLTWKHTANMPPYVEMVENEGKMLKRFKEVVLEEKPDVMVGYNSDNFDLPYLITRANKYDIKLSLGVDGSELKYSDRGIRINGIANFDIYIFIKNIISPTMRVENFKLGTVGEELVGDTKLEAFNKADIYNIWDRGGNGLIDLAEYNLQDSRLVLKIYRKLSYTIYELCKLVGVPLFDISRMTYGQMVEEFLIRRANIFNEFVPPKPEGIDMSGKKYEGAYVHTPKEGLYDDIVIYDFKSLYPSIIVSYNIGPTTIGCDCCGTGGYSSEEIDGKRFYFCRNIQGFIPHYIEDLIERRNTIKEIMSKMDKDDKHYKVLSARSYAIKTIANAMYGYLGFSKSRWFCLECAASITSFGRKYIKWVMEEAEKEGFNVIYGDTDSIMMSLGKKSRGDADKFLKQINDQLPGVMELDFQGFYPRGIFVSAKKRYALADEKKRITIKGFEFVRRDWSRIARETQKKVLTSLLIDRSEKKALEVVREAVRRLKNHEVEIKDVIINTQLTRRIEHYESVGPHVAAVKKAMKGGIKFEPGQIIEYVVSEGEGSISDRSYLIRDFENKKLKYDAEYYINNQVLAAVDKILGVLGYSKEQLKGKSQTTLGGFLG